MIHGVSVWTLWHGAELTGAGNCELLADSLRVLLAEPPTEVQVPFASLDGAHFAGDHLTLYASHGDVIELSGAPGLDELEHALRSHACVVPEMTLALHGLGSARQTYRRTDHDRFFAPFLSARRAAQRADDAAGRLTALRASAIAAELERVLHEFAVERFPASLSDRRALETELQDLAAPVHAGLRRLDEAAQVAASARDDTAFSAWRTWTDQCRDVFVQADRCWLQTAPVLLANPVPQRRRWWRPRRRPAS